MNLKQIESHVLEGHWSNLYLSLALQIPEINTQEEYARLSTLIEMMICSNIQENEVLKRKCIALGSIYADRAIGRLKHEANIKAQQVANQLKVVSNDPKGM